MLSLQTKRCHMFISWSRLQSCSSIGECRVHDPDTVTSIGPSLSLFSYELTCHLPFISSFTANTKSTAYFYHGTLQPQALQY